MSRLLLDTNILVYAKIHDFDIISIALANECNEIATFNSSDFKAVKEITLLNI